MAGDQPTDETPALELDPEPQVVDTTAVEEPVEQPPPPVRAAEEEVAPTGGPEPSFEPSGAGGTSPREAHHAAVEAQPDRPELAVLGAFVGGLLIAQILKRLGGGDE